LPIADYTELFDLIGTTYGGDGQQTFALPDLRGRAPVHQGTLSGEAFQLGARVGVEAVAVTDAQLPAHTHQLHATGQPAESTLDAMLAVVLGSDARPYGTAGPQVSLAPPMLGSSGGGQPHSNLQPYLVLNFIIAVEQMPIMSGPFIAEIRIFPYSAVPTGWASCRGQLLPIAQNTPLFSLLGTTFGGDGRNNFALPNLQAATPMGTGQGPGLSERGLGETGGSATVALIVSEDPVHTHALVASDAAGTQIIPNGQLTAATPALGMYGPPATMVPLSPQAVGGQGDGQGHNNLQPYLVLTICIALQGTAPSRG
jgi:microcystin-dependent protein